MVSWKAPTFNSAYRIKLLSLERFQVLLYQKNPFFFGLPTVILDRLFKIIATTSTHVLGLVKKSENFQTNKIIHEYKKSSNALITFECVERISKNKHWFVYFVLDTIQERSLIINHKICRRPFTLVLLCSLESMSLYRVVTKFCDNRLNNNNEMLHLGVKNKNSAKEGVLRINMCLNNVLHYNFNIIIVKTTYRQYYCLLWEQSANKGHSKIIYSGCICKSRMFNCAGSAGLYTYLLSRLLEITFKISPVVWYNTECTLSDNRTKTVDK